MSLRGALPRVPSAAGMSRPLAAVPRPFSLSYPTLYLHAHSQPAAGALGVASARTYATIIRTNRVASLSAQIKPKKVVHLGKIMGILRDLELLDKWEGRTPKSGNGYKDATRALYPLWHIKECSDKGKVNTTFEEIENALDPLQTHAWTAISQLLLEGKVSALTSLSAEDKAALLFLQVYGVGPRYVEKFIAAGARTLKQLSKLPLTRGQKIGIQHFDDIGLLISRAEMTKLASALESAVRDVDPKFECAVLGSYRREVAFSSDIDFVIRHPSLRDTGEAEADEYRETSKALLGQVIAKLEKLKLINDNDRLTSGDKKYSGMVKLPRHRHLRRIDIRLAPYDSFPYMQLSTTGDALLMKLTRHMAKAKGYTLNEYGMGKKWDKEDQNPNGFRPGTLVKVKDEKEIFKILGLPFLEPNQRDFSTWKQIYKDAGLDDALSYVDRL